MHKEDRMTKKISVILLSALALSGCGSVDEAINDVLSGDVTTETIASKERVLIINGVSRTACVTIKNGLAENGTRENSETLVTGVGVTCATYGKIEGDPLALEQDTQCAVESLADWLDQESNGNITDFDSASGEQACVIGFDI